MTTPMYVLVMALYTNVFQSSPVALTQVSFTSLEMCQKAGVQAQALKLNDGNRLTFTCLPLYGK